MSYMALEIVQEICSLLGKDFTQTLRGLRRVSFSKGVFPSIVGYYDFKYRPCYPHEIDDILLNFQKVEYDCRFWVVTLYKDEKNFVLQGYDEFSDAEEREAYHKSFGLKEVFMIDLGRLYYETT